MTEPRIIRSHEPLPAEADGPPLTPDEVWEAMMSRPEFAWQRRHDATAAANEGRDLGEPPTDPTADVWRNVTSLDS